MNSPHSSWSHPTSGVSGLSWWRSLCWGFLTGSFCSFSIMPLSWEKTRLYTFFQRFLACCKGLSKLVIGQWYRWFRLSKGFFLGHRLDLCSLQNPERHNFCYQWQAENLEKDRSLPHDLVSFFAELLLFCFFHRVYGQVVSKPPHHYHPCCLWWGLTV